MITRRQAGLALGAAALLTRAGSAAAQAPAAPPAAPVNPSFHRFRIGGFTATTVFDGIGRLPTLEGLVVNAPLESVRGTLAESFLPTDHYITPYTLTVVQTPRHTVLFDAGTGGQLAPTAGQAASNLRAAGIDPARIDIVALTHVHGDHITGLTTAEGQKSFPNAEIVIPDMEWRYWSDESNAASAPQRQKPNFANLKRRLAPYGDRIRRVQEGQEATAGIRAVMTPGHTPGHTSWHVADGDAQFLILGDVTHRPELFVRRPGLHAMYDFDPAAAEVTRRHVLDRCAADRVRVTGYHFPFPANGFIARDGEGFRFVPADWTA
ncbi:MBL fold metallo-hydrolase [Roseomonas sp. SSH11]|uniref:MBL fold metallo-hydrolase n=1 Tax=Pararoseomonas baculiformis TaxID=2820812 RepID=A0ABS4AKM8_9PROT|nr:MBL fold metallo-hydrolase [Pararoseomonas baculiformis]MBP0447587.1 MBL fold metallo-hydrolase [Pararoseomonas baculiformis]